MTEEMGVFFSELHKRVGVCGHCGKRKCPQRDSWSVLPDKIKSDEIVAAAAATEEEGLNR